MSKLREKIEIILATKKTDLEGYVEELESLILEEKREVMRLMERKCQIKTNLSNGVRSEIQQKELNELNEQLKQLEK